MIWSVPKSWPGEACFILAGGPSLRGFDPEQLRGKGRIIAINDSWRLCSWADVLYFCDASWWADQVARNLRSLDGRLSFLQMADSGFWVTGSVDFPGHPQVRQLRLTGQMGLETDPRGLRHGSNSGYQAINLAVHFGANRILLLGYDMHVEADRTHWHDGPRENGFANILRDSMLPLFSKLVEPLAAAGVEVLNATPGSVLKCWPAVDLSEILSGGTAVRAEDLNLAAAQDLT